jgi:hypothetical protein
LSIDPIGENDKIWKKFYKAIGKQAKANSCGKTGFHGRLEKMK